MNELTLQPVRRLFKKVGAKRVSDDAARELAKLIEDRTKNVVIEASRLAKHSGRRTTMKRDIKLARKNLGV
jgi:histone H3/H4